MSFDRDDYCFACGKENPDGLQLDIKAEDGHSHTKMKFPLYMQGYSGVVHGGLISTVLDELAVYAGISLGNKYATGEIKVRFKKPVKTGVEYLIMGEVIDNRDKIVTAKSFIKDSDGVTYAEAEAKLIKINE
jgi:uncharacterized protein (TIGR00369 family)